MADPTLRYLSLGAGRQSTALYLLACAGHFGDERPAVAYFADTGAEPQAVYEHLDRLERERGHIIPIERVSAGRIQDGLLGAGRFAGVPTFTSNGGMTARQCTRDYKIVPIERAVRQRLGLAKGQRVPKGTLVEAWMGISTDEATRMRDNRKPWIRNRYPLALELGWTAHDCARYVEAQGFLAAKSACVFCPYTSAARWRELAERGGPDWELAVRVDEGIRNHGRGMRAQKFLTRRLLPLIEFVRQESTLDHPDLFESECEGLCSV